LTSGTFGCTRFFFLVRVRSRLPLRRPDASCLFSFLCVLPRRLPLRFFSLFFRTITASSLFSFFFLSVVVLVFQIAACLQGSFPLTFPPPPKSTPHRFSRLTPPPPPKRASGRLCFFYRSGFFPTRFVIKLSGLPAPAREAFIHPVFLSRPILSSLLPSSEWGNPFSLVFFF